MENKIKVSIERCLYSSGFKPFYLTCYTHNIIRNNIEFYSLKELKDYYGINRVTKKEKKGWALNSRGNKITWIEYETLISTDFVYHSIK